MKDVNKVFLIGRLGKDPEQRETKNGLSVVRFTLATSRRVADASEASGYKEETQWLNIVVWGKQAETCKQYLGKGHKVHVEGMIRVRRFTHKDNTPGVSFEIHAESVVFLGRGRSKSEIETVPVQESEAFVAEAS